MESLFHIAGRECAQRTEITSVALFLAYDASSSIDGGENNSEAEHRPAAVSR